MTKTNQKRCYQSSTNSRQPKCKFGQQTLCSSCCEAMVRYNQYKLVKKLQTRDRNRESAQLSKFRREEKFSDSLAENIALTDDLQHLTNVLADIKKNNDTIALAIAALSQQKNALSTS